MIRYYCSGFDVNNAFGHGLGEMFLNELSDRKSIVYIPGSPNKIEKAKDKYVPAFNNHFKNVGINFEEETIITPDMKKEIAQEKVRNASFIMLMGGDPFEQKNMCEMLGLLPILKEYKGIMLGLSAGAMLMSKYIIITPCSEEYPDFHIEAGLNLDGISVYPHNNTNDEEYPEILCVGKEEYRKSHLLKVATDYEEFYLLQDSLDNGNTNVSIIKSNNGIIECYHENNGKVWMATKDDIKLVNASKKIGSRKVFPIVKD